MLNDFISGSLRYDRAQAIIEPLQKLIKSTRDKGIPVIYSNDSHHQSIDNELKLWGDHAICGSKGAEIIDELKPENSIL